MDKTAELRIAVLGKLPQEPRRKLVEWLNIALGAEISTAANGRG
jgi:hypothetical protein